MSFQRQETGRCILLLMGCPQHQQSATSWTHEPFSVRIQHNFGSLIHTSQPRHRLQHKNGISVDHISFSILQKSIRWIKGHFGFCCLGIFCKFVELSIRSCLAMSNCSQQISLSSPSLFMPWFFVFRMKLLVLLAGAVVEHSHQMVVAWPLAQQVSCNLSLPSATCFEMLHESFHTLRCSMWSKDTTCTWEITPHTNNPWSQK